MDWSHFTELAEKLEKIADVPVGQNAKLLGTASLQTIALAAGALRGMVALQTLDLGEVEVPKVKLPEAPEDRNAKISLELTVKNYSNSGKAVYLHMEGVGKRWLPLSQILMVPRAGIGRLDAGAKVAVTMPAWLAREKGFAT